MFSAPPSSSSSGETLKEPGGPLVAWMSAEESRQHNKRLRYLQASTC